MTRSAYRLFPACIWGVLLFAAAFAVGILSASPAEAARSRNSNLSMQAEDEMAESKRVTWNLTADKLTSLGSSDVLEARGNVILRRGAEYLKADYARYYATTKWVFLRGNVEALMGKDTMTAHEAEFDLRSRVGWLKQGRIFMDGPHMYLAGERIDKHWGDVYTFKQAKITLCDGDTPAWSFAAEEAVVEIDGYAQLWKTKFQIADIPAVFTPWMMLPAKKDRQTGFLMPEYGNSSLLGSYANIPFFWAIDESRDLTVNANFMDKRGVMQGVQYRSRPSENEMTWLRFDVLEDKKRVTNDASDPVIPYDGLGRTNTTRFWLRGMHEGFVFDPKWKFRANIDYASDQNFLYEFRHGMSGFDESRDTLLELFHRDIAEKDQTRESGAMIFRDWDRISVALSATYEHNQRLGHGNARRSTDTTVQHLPRADFFLHKGRIAESLPLEIGASAQAAYMYRREGTQGMRYVLQPELSLPLANRYGSLMFVGGVQQSFYGTNAYGSDSPEQRDRTQTVPYMRIDASTELERTYEWNATPLAASAETLGKTRWTAVRHIIQPRLNYTNTPREDQSRQPFYDDKDRIRPINELTYSITNVLTRKRDRVVAVKGKEGEAATYATASDYLDVARLTLEQTYDIRESRREDERGAFVRRPFGDLVLDGQFLFDQYLSLTSRVYWSVYNNHFTRQDHALRLTLPAWGYLAFGHGYRRELAETPYRQQQSDVKSIDFEGMLDLTGPFAVAWLYKYDYIRKENAERELMLIYNHQCFQVLAAYGRDERETHYRIKFRLAGIGDDGKSARRSSR